MYTAAHYNYITIPPGLVLYPFVLRFCFNTLYLFTPLLKTPYHFWFNALWLAAFYYTAENL